MQFIFKGAQGKETIENLTEALNDEFLFHGKFFPDIILKNEKPKPATMKNTILYVYSSNDSLTVIFKYNNNSPIITRALNINPQLKEKIQKALSKNSQTNLTDIEAGEIQHNAFRKVNITFTVNAPFCVEEYPAQKAQYLIYNNHVLAQNLPSTDATLLDLDQWDEVADEYKVKYYNEVSTKKDSNLDELEKYINQYHKDTKNTQSSFISFAQKHLFHAPPNKIDAKPCQEDKLENSDKKSLKNPTQNKRKLWSNYSDSSTSDLSTTSQTYSKNSRS